MTVRVFVSVKILKTSEKQSRKKTRLFHVYVVGCYGANVWLL